MRRTRGLSGILPRANTRTRTRIQRTMQISDTKKTMKWKTVKYKKGNIEPIES